MPDNTKEYRRRYNTKQLNDLIKEIANENSFVTDDNKSAYIEHKKNAIINNVYYHQPEHIITTDEAKQQAIDEYKNKQRKKRDVVFEIINRLQADNSQSEFLKNRSNAKKLKTYWNRYVRSTQFESDDIRYLLIHNFKNFRDKDQKDKNIETNYFTEKSIQDSIQGINKDPYLEKINDFLFNQDLDDDTKDHNLIEFNKASNRKKLSKINKSFWTKLTYILFAPVPASEGSVNFHLLKGSPMNIRAASAGSCYGLNTFMFGGIVPDIVKSILCSEHYFQMEEDKFHAKSQLNLLKGIQLEHFLLIAIAQTTTILSVLGLTITATSALFPPAIVVIASICTAIAIAALVYPDLKEMISKLDFSFSKKFRDYICKNLYKDQSLPAKILTIPIFIALTPIFWSVAFASDILINNLLKPIYDIKLSGSQNLKRHIDNYNKLKEAISDFFDIQKSFLKEEGVSLTNKDCTIFVISRAFKILSITIAISASLLSVIAYTALYSGNLPIGLHKMFGVFGATMEVCNKLGTACAWITSTSMLAFNYQSAIDCINLLENFSYSTYKSILEPNHKNSTKKNLLSILNQLDPREQKNYYDYQDRTDTINAITKMHKDNLEKLEQSFYEFILNIKTIYNANKENASILYKLNLYIKSMLSLIINLTTLITIQFLLIIPSVTNISMLILPKPIRNLIEFTLKKLTMPVILAMTAFNAYGQQGGIAKGVGIIGKSASALTIIALSVALMFSCITSNFKTPATKISKVKKIKFNNDLIPTISSAVNTNPGTADNTQSPAVPALSPAAQPHI